MLVRLEGGAGSISVCSAACAAPSSTARFPPASRLPSTRALAADLDLSRNVVALAFAQLGG